ncbi:MAG TPA: TlpA disulfide reductase family protein [Bryobacteraceae bacterium]
MDPRNPISRRKALAALGYSLSIPAASVALDFHDQVKFKAKTLDGQNLSNESVQGKVVLVQFWATWCPYCRSDAPAVDALQREFRDRLVVLAVDVGESKRTVTQYLARSPRECKIVLMTDTNLAAWFGPKSYPHYALIGRDGREAGEQKGAGGERSLRRLLHKAGLQPEDVDGPDDLQSSPRRD